MRRNGRPAVRRLATLAAAAGILIGVGTCTETNIYHRRLSPNIPNKVAISGRVCTDDPAQRQFPVKTMFIVDTSGSMSTNDPESRRWHATEDIINRYVTAANHEFAIISFASETRQLTQDLTTGSGYTKNLAILREAVAQLGLVDSGARRDWLGALSLASSIFTGDLLTTNPGTRSRTRYVFIFLANGPPFPRPDPPDIAVEKSRLRDEVEALLTFGAENGVAEVAMHTVQLDDRPGTCQGAPEYFCNATTPCPPNCAGGEVCQAPTPRCTDDPSVTCVDSADCTAVCEYLSVCSTDNATVCNIAENCCPTLVCDDAWGTSAFNEETAELLKAMSTTGRGTFLRFTSAPKLNFWALDYDSSSTYFVKKAFIITNLNARSQDGAIVPDSDIDGMTDWEEACYGEMLSGQCERITRCSCALDVWDNTTNPAGTDTDPAKADTDGDGLSDMLETLFATVNLDPLRTDIPEACAVLSRPYGDRDADGLNDCEEQVLGTDLTLFDSDRDGYPDRLEFLYGTNYMQPDNLKDIDMDGLNNGLELELHLDPQADDIEARSGDAYRYKVEDEGLRVMPYTSQAHLVYPGVEVTDVASRSVGGAGTLYYWPGPPAQVAWRDPGDSVPGRRVTITGSGDYLLYSECSCVRDCVTPPNVGEWCNPSTGVPQSDPCVLTTCLSTEKCDPGSGGRCLPDCTRAACELGQRCDPLLGKCLTDRCLNASCPSGEACDTEAGVCAGPPCQGWTCAGAGMRVDSQLKPPWISIHVDEDLLPRDGFWCDGGKDADGTDNPPCNTQADCTGSPAGECRIREAVKVGLADKNCISFKVKNVTLVETLETTPGFGGGHNNIFAYFAQTPQGSPTAYSIFRASLINIRYINGIKDPDWAEVPLTDGDFFQIEEK